MQIPDSEILALIVSGDLVVGLDNPETIQLFGREVKGYFIGAYARNPERRRFAFGFQIKGRRRTIVRSKLVYIAGSLRLLPDEFEVHHLDEDRHNDDYQNLIAVHGDDHKKIHAFGAYDSTEAFLNS